MNKPFASQKLLAKMAGNKKLEAVELRVHTPVRLDSELQEHVCEQPCVRHEKWSCSIELVMEGHKGSVLEHERFLGCDPVDVLQSAVSRIEPFLRSVANNGVDVRWRDGSRRLWADTKDDVRGTEAEASHPQPPAAE